MNIVFIIATGSPLAVTSRRTTSIARAFQIARNFPSAIMVWNGDNHTPIANGIFNSAEELNQFFDQVRKEM